MNKMTKTVAHDVLLWRTQARFHTDIGVTRPVILLAGLAPESQAYLLRRIRRRSLHLTSQGTAMDIAAGMQLVTAAERLVQSRDENPSTLALQKDSVQQSLFPEDED